MTALKRTSIFLLTLCCLVLTADRAAAQSPAWEVCPWSASPCCVGTVGDINGDGIDAGPVDLAYLVDFLFVDGASPACDDEADLNQDGSSADPTDLSILVDILFDSGSNLPLCP